MLILTLVFANSLFFSFSFITSASVAPKYLNPFQQILPLSAHRKELYPQTLLSFVN